MTITCSSSEHVKRKYPLRQREYFCSCKTVRSLFMQKSGVGSSENTEHDTEQEVRLVTFVFILLNGLKIFQVF